MPFPCPGCDAAVPRSAVRWLQRCPTCGAWLRGRPVETDGPEPAFEVEVAGRPQTRRRVTLPWDATARRRLAAWLVAASVVTVALVLVLFVLARAL